MDSDYGYAADAAAPTKTARLNKDMPLTAELRDTTSSHLSTATRIFNTLYELRDRIHGPTPTTRGVGADPRPDPGCFVGTIRDLNGELTGKLDGIESLLTEFANRL